MVKKNNKVNKNKKDKKIETFEDLMISNIEEIGNKENKDNKYIDKNNQNEGRTVIVRGENGEILISSTNLKDNLKDMARIAMEEYHNGKGQASPSYIL